MKLNKITNENGQHQVLPSFRSVGHIPCDFHRLKYTTSYRNFSRKNVAIEQQKQSHELKLNLQLQLTDRRQENPLKFKKGQGLVDKWKQKYKRVEEDYLFQRRKSYDCLPDIRRNLQDINEKFRITKYISPPKKQKEFPNQKKKKLENEEKMQQNKGQNRLIDFRETFKSSNQLRKAYSLSINQKSPLKISKKKSRSNNLLGLRAVQEMPARWQTFQQQDELPTV